MVIEVCDLCRNSNVSYRFKVKMSKRKYYGKTDYGGTGSDLWKPYKRVYVCENCAKKLFDIKPDRISAKEVSEMVREVTVKK